MSHAIMAACALFCAAAWGAVGYDFSGFATLGGAISDQDFVYQRDIDNQGTVNRDSLIGVQLDASLSNTWGLTLQAKAAPSTHDENAWDPTLSWAFISWRPTNDLLLRAGKLRIPLMLYSASSDVGITFEVARLPSEVYSILPTTDINGLSVAKTWLDAGREWSLEAYAGHTHTDWRYYLRNDLQPAFSAGPLYLGFDMDMAGLVGTLRAGTGSLRIGLHRAEATADRGALPSRYPFVTLAPGIGYFQVDDAIPGPGVPNVDTLILDVFTLGAEGALPRDFKLVAEYGRRRIRNAVMGPDTHAGYIALFKPMGRWTPYVYWSGIRTIDSVLDAAVALNETRLPEAIPGAALINASQRVSADLMSPYDQQSLALGTAYSLSLTSKVKLEWQHTRTGRLSSLIDPPAGEDSGGRQVNVFSLSYSLAF